MTDDSDGPSPEPREDPDGPVPDPDDDTTEPDDDSDGPSTAPDAVDGPADRSREPDRETGRVGPSESPRSDDEPPDPDDVSPADVLSPLEERPEAAWPHGREGSLADPDETVTDAADIEPEELTLSMQALNPRIRYVWIAGALINAGILAAIAFAIDWFLLDVGVALPIGVFALFALLGTVHALLRYRVWRFEVRPDALYLKRGVLTTVRTVVPYVRIQHVDASRGPIERAVGLATSVVYTAGSRGADVTIPGLTPDQAEDLQDRLKRLAIAAEGDDAV